MPYRPLTSFQPRAAPRPPVPVPVDPPAPAADSARPEARQHDAHKYKTLSSFRPPPPPPPLPAERLSKPSLRRQANRGESDVPRKKRPKLQSTTGNASPLLKPLTSLSHSNLVPSDPAPRTKQLLTSRANQLLHEAPTVGGADHKLAESTRLVPPKKPLTTLVPARPSVGGITNDGRDDDDDEDFSFSSPEKRAGNAERSKNHLPSGIAARAQSVLQASKTDHTLWLHEILRTLHTHPAARSGFAADNKGHDEDGGGVEDEKHVGDRPSSKRDDANDTRGRGTTASTRARARMRGVGWNKYELERALEPELKLVIIEVLDRPISTTTTTTATAPADNRAGGRAAGRGDRKTLLTRCRLDLSPTRPPSSPNLEVSSRATSRDRTTTGGGGGGEGERGARDELSDPDLTGLVLFSLHHQQPSSSSSSSSAPPWSRRATLQYPQVRPSTKTSTTSLFIPEGPHDLTTFVPGLEVWVFGDSSSSSSSGSNGLINRAGGRGRETSSRTTTSRGISEVELNEDQDSWRVVIASSSSSSSSSSSTISTTTSRVKVDEAVAVLAALDDDDKTLMTRPSFVGTDEGSKDVVVMSDEKPTRTWKLRDSEEEEEEAEEEEENKRKRIRKGLIVTKFGLLVEN